MTREMCLRKDEKKEKTAGDSETRTTEYVCCVYTTHITCNNNGKLTMFIMKSVITRDNCMYVFVCGVRDK